MLWVPNIVTAGQSNDLGGGNLSDLASNQQFYRLPFQHVRYQQQLNCPVTVATSSLGCETQTDQFAALAPRNNGVNEFIGPELTLGRGLWDRGGERSFTLMKSATNGSSAQNWIDFLLPRALDFIQLQSQGPTRLWNWVHGESATGSDSNASNYPSQLIQIFLTLRSFLRTLYPTDPFGEAVIVMNLLHVNTYALDPPRAARVPVVRAGQISVASQMDRCHLVNVDHLPLKADSLHYTTQSFLDMGELFVTKAISHPDLLVVPTPQYFA